MTSMLIVLVAGAAVGLGVALIVWLFVPATPDLGSALQTFSGSQARRSDSAARGRQGSVESWIYTHAPGWLVNQLPTQQLDLVDESYAHHMTKKVLFAAWGLLFPLFLAALLWIGGIPVPVLTLLSVPLCLLAFFAPDIQLRKDAADARAEFHLTVASYIELTGIASKAGLSHSQALEHAAETGSSPVFLRLRREITRSRLASEQPWEGLTRLSRDLDIPELSELADIMKTGSEQGSIVYDSLRSKGRTQRMALLNAEAQKANATTERMTIPMTCLALVFAVILLGPSLMNFMSL